MFRDRLLNSMEFTRAPIPPYRDIPVRPKGTQPAPRQATASIDRSLTFCHSRAVDPLCSHGANGPFIHDGRFNRRHRGQETVRGADEYQLVFVDDGTVRYRSGRATHSPATPCAMLVQPGADFAMNLPRGITWHHLRFDAVYEPRAVRTKPLPGQTPPFVHRRTHRQPSPEKVWGLSLPLEVPAAFLDETRAMVRWCNAHWWRDALNYARANYHLGLWLLDLARLVEGKTVRPAGWLEELKQYCADNIIHGLSVKELARHAGMSRQNLRCRLRASCRMSPKSFLDSVRMDLACRLLRSTGDPIRSVSRACGFSSVPVFSRWFKKLTGLPPRPWRQRKRVL